MTANSPVEQLAPDLLIYDLALLRGNDALLNRIPDATGGVYAWYRRFAVPPRVRDDEAAFADFLLSELDKPHSVTRSTWLPPAYRVSLAADTVFSKERHLRDLSSRPAFRELVLLVLEKAIFFQQPLYIGKSVDLRNRIRSHLRDASPLRRRLLDAGHSIDECKLLLIFTPVEAVDVSHETESEEEDFGNTPSDQLLEDILSRLFLPTFTLRYG